MLTGDNEMSYDGVSARICSMADQQQASLTLHDLLTAAALVELLPVSPAYTALRKVAGIGLAHCTLAMESQKEFDNGE